MKLRSTSSDKKKMLSTSSPQLPGSFRMSNLLSISEIITLTIATFAAGAIFFDHFLNVSSSDLNTLEPGVGNTKSFHVCI